MDNHSTDTQHGRASGDEIDYWLMIDKIDSELSGDPLKYHSDPQVSESLGVNQNIIHDMLYRLRPALLELTRKRDKMR